MPGFSVNAKSLKNMTKFFKPKKLRRATVKISDIYELLLRESAN